MDVAAFDGSDGLNPTHSCFGLSQGSKALAVAKEPFHGCMIALNVEKGLCGFGIPPRSQTEVDHLLVCIDGAPEITPLGVDADVSLIDVPI